MSQIKKLQFFLLPLLAIPLLAQAANAQTSTSLPARLLMPAATPRQSLPVQSTESVPAAVENDNLNQPDPSLLLPIPDPVVAYPTFNSKQMDQQLILYQQYVAVSGPPDVLIVGSSRALQGVDPIALQQTLAKQGHLGMKIFNFGINGATAQVVDLLLRQILTPEQQPRLILWADGVRAFNSGRIDVTYNGIIASPGYKFLQKTRLSKQLQPPTSTRITANPAVSEAKKAGFHASYIRFNPATYYQRHPKVLGVFDADYRDFTLQGKQITALKRVLAFTRSRQLPVVFVNLPLTKDYLDPARRNYEQQFQQSMQQLARQKQLIFRNLNQQELARNEYFVDPSHLNRFGAYAVATKLGRDTTIPWPIPSSPIDILSYKLSSWRSLLSLLADNWVSHNFKFKSAAGRVIS